MGLSRRFLNLLVSEPYKPGTSLLTMDLGRHELFYPPGTPPPPAPLNEPLTLPSPAFSFRSTWLGCLPVADRKVLCTDRHQHAFFVDAATQHVVTIPTRRAFKFWGIPDDPDGTLFVMERWPEHERRYPEPESQQFEALVYGRASKSSPAKSWRSQLLPPLPYLRNPRYWKFNVGVTSYAIVGGGSHIVVSLKPCITQSEERLKVKNEMAGTYCLDTVNHTWSKVGDWTLPFVGKVEYVPELKLWFGMSCGLRKKLAAADLSLAAMAGSEPPQLVAVGVWETETDLPYDDHEDENGWMLRQFADPKVAYLGSGRFCIARCLKHVNLELRSASDTFAVLTGVEVTTPSQVHGGSRDDGGEANELHQMIRHKSRVLPSGTRIDALF